MKKVIQEMRKHRRKWDANFAEMGPLKKWRKVAVPHLLAPWHPSSAWDEPGADIVPDMSNKFKQKIVVMDYVDQHSNELDWGPVLATGLSTSAMQFGIWQRDGEISTRRRIGPLTAACRPWWPMPVCSSQPRKKVRTKAKHKSGATSRPADSSLSSSDASLLRMK